MSAKEDLFRGGECIKKTAFPIDLISHVFYLKGDSDA